jgi:flagellar biogenesis protein FliO
MPLFYDIAAGNVGTAFSSVHVAGVQSAEISVGRVFAALLLCLFVAVAVIVMIKVRPGAKPSLSLQDFRMRFRKPSTELKLIESRRISAHADICLLKYHENEYLVACGPGHIVLIDKVATGLSTGGCEAENSTSG